MGIGIGTRLFAFTAHVLIIKIRKLAEGVVSEPLLPSGDQGRKGGFAPSTGQFIQSAHYLSFAQ
jgi:hypothetical protein